MHVPAEPQPLLGDGQPRLQIPGALRLPHHAEAPDAGPYGHQDHEAPEHRRRDHPGQDAAAHPDGGEEPDGQGRQDQGLDQEGTDRDEQHLGDHQRHRGVHDQQKQPVVVDAACAAQRRQQPQG